MATHDSFALLFHLFILVPVTSDQVLSHIIWTHFIVRSYSLTLLSLPLLVAQYSIRYDEFSSEQHLDRVHTVGGRVVLYIHWSVD